MTPAAHHRREQEDDAAETIKETDHGPSRRRESPARSTTATTATRYIRCRSRHGALAAPTLKRFADRAADPASTAATGRRGRDPRTPNGSHRSRTARRVRWPRRSPIRGRAYPDNRLIKVMSGTNRAGTIRTIPKTRSTQMTLRTDPTKRRIRARRGPRTSSRPCAAPRASSSVPRPTARDAAARRGNSRHSAMACDSDRPDSTWRAIRRHESSRSAS